MQLITTITPNSSGPQVTNLIDALFILLRGGVFESADPRNRVSADDLKKLAAQLDEERAKQQFGPATTQLVQHLQIQQGLGEKLGGVVDEATAARMNDILRRLGEQIDEIALEVSGMVYDQASRRLTHIEVRVFDRDVQRESLLGHAFTDETGVYRVTYPQALYRKTSAERGGPELIARAFDAQGLLLGESDLLADAGPSAQLDIVVTESLLLVSGAVRDEAGRALPGLTVRAFDRDLRNEELLGSAATDAQGGYQIPYVAHQFRRTEKERADLVVRVFAAGIDTALSSSKILFNAPARAVVDLTISAAALNTRSEWERYGLALAPLLDNVMPRDLTPEDLDFLAAETGFPREHLRLMHLDAKWRSQFPQHKLAASVYYGLLRQGLPDQLSMLLRAGVARWREAIKQAVADRQVQQALGGLLEELLRILTTIAVDAAFVAPDANVPADAEPGVGVLLGASDVAPDVQRRIAAAMVDIDADADEASFIKALDEAGVAPPAIDSARFAIQSINLLGGHVPTLAQLQRTEAKDFARATDLARLSRAQWLKVAQGLEAQGALPDKAAPAAQYATQLADYVEAAFPTQVYAHQLVTARQPLRQAVGQLLLQNPSFDLLSTPVGAFMKQANFDSIYLPAGELADQLGKEARVARLTAPGDRAQQASELLAKGMHSAIHVAALGRKQFVSLMSGKVTAAQAQRVYRNARLRTDEIVLQATRARDYLDFPVRALASAEPTPGSELASWAGMFGNLNGCYCPPCDSAHGPAAYLMDLFEFLKEKDADLIEGGRSLLEILFERRQDLKHLNLNCANAMTPLPYIDLVIELLESHIADAWDAEHVPQTPEIGDAGEIAARLRALPRERNLEALRAEIPQTLAAAGYPWSWPFDAAFANAAVNFNVIGATPAEVLAFGTDASAELARARLGLSAAHWGILHGSHSEETAEVAAAWGVDADAFAALTVIGTETGLLLRSGLAVGELFALLESPLFAGWSLVIDRTADPCDIDAARLRQQPPDPEADPIDLDAPTQTEVFDLLHRVLRLRLALGWPLPRLTTALQALGLGRDARALDLHLLSGLADLAARAAVSVQRIAELLMAIEPARDAWLALLRVASADYDDLVALGLADPMSAISAEDQLTRAAAALETLELLKRVGVEPAELRYLLLSEDRVPGLYAPRAGEHIRLLDELKRDIDAAVVDLVRDAGQSPEEFERARRRRQVGAIVERLAAITGASFVVDVVAADLNVADPTVARPALLAATVDGVAGGVVEDFIANAESMVADATVEPSDAEVFEILRRETAAANSLWRVTKACRLLTLLGMNAADVRSLSQLPALFDFNLLPPARTGGGLPLTIDSLRPLIEAALTQRALPGKDVRLLDVLAHANTDVSVSEQLESLTGWGRALTPRTDAPDVDGAGVLRGLAAQLGLTPDAGTLAPWQSPALYARLQEVVGWMQARRLTAGASRSDLATLRAAALDPVAGADDLEMLARSRFASDREYHAAITPAMDRLRIARRNALLARIVHGGPFPAGVEFRSADDVYAYLLIDVQMGPCQLTSRIVQAHAAVQLFVQRCLMNLERASGVQLGDVSDIAEWREWEWMKNYRVWEAARKVFLYPENWIEPELRDLKSPFFEDLENELLQDEITDATAERALRGYLRKLHEVARLDIRAMCEELVFVTDATGASTTRTVLHVVARTRAAPHVYYHRNRDEGGAWRPWEKIEQSVTGDHVLLTAFNGRITLLWATFKEVQTGVVAGATEQPHELAVTLHWTTRVLGTWSATRQGELPGTIEPADRAGWTIRVARNGIEGVVVKDYVQRGSDRPYLFVRGNPDAAYNIDACTGELIAISQRRSDLRYEYVIDLPPRLVAVDNRLLENPDAADSPLTVDASRSALPVLQKPMHGFTVVFGDPTQFFFADAARQFLATRRTVGIQEIKGAAQIGAIEISGVFGPRRARTPPTRWVTRDVLQFENHYHPYLCTMLERMQAVGPLGLFRAGEPAGYDPEYTGWTPREFPRQRMHEPASSFVTRYRPRDALFGSYPYEQFEFAFDAAYSLYNWEIFFHLPVLLADRLSKAGRYAEAQKWLHCVFDPTDVSNHGTPEKYWRVKPLFEAASQWHDRAESLDEMMRRLALGAPDIEAQVAAWRADPFNPHLLARMRLVAYMKSVVQKYIENLMAWADSLFRRDTIESLNEAMQLYVLAAGILGPAPVAMPPMVRTARSYQQLSDAEFIDDFANSLVALENSIADSTADARAGERAAPRLPMLYFCIPSNARLQELREKIADRLFKIRHCMDIDGRSRQLALFAAPIDPALLVRARAAGLDLAAVINLPTASRRNYRFGALLQKALEFTGELRGFGGALLAALEKRDGEQLAQLRAQHEVSLLKRAAEIRQQQLEEATINLEAARRARLQAQARLDFYASRQFMSAGEQNQVSNMRVAHALETVGQEFKLLASILHIIPDFKAGMDVGATFGGRNLGDAMGAVGDVFGFIASQSSFQANMSALMAGHDRRKDDWDFQADLARKEVAQIEQQIIAAEIRLAIAEREQRNHEQQIAQSEEAEVFLRDKFTNAQLYNWMSAQLSALHYQAYRMALDLAHQTQVAAEAEVGPLPPPIGLDHWDGSRKGLLAGDRLAQDLRRLELNYLNANRRRFELTSHLSLRRVDALALMNLRVGGYCAFTVSPAVLDLDFPGQVQRRVKSISISIPGVVGPYVGVHGRLRVREPGAGGAAAAIVTSSGQNDSGVFQLDFRDERYLPFESMNLDADTSWEFTLPEVHAFDYGTISDVILHVQYTAQESSGAAGGARWSADAGTAPGWSGAAATARHYQLLDVRHDFPDAWRQLRETGAAQVVHLGDDLFPYLARGRVAVRGVIGPPGRDAIVLSPIERELTLVAADAGDGAAERAAGFGYLIVQYDMT